MRKIQWCVGQDCLSLVNIHANKKDAEEDIRCAKKIKSMLYYATPNAQMPLDNAHRNIPECLKQNKRTSCDYNCKNKTHVQPKQVFSLSSTRDGTALLP
jgi:hypothetical protein